MKIGIVIPIYNEAKTIGDIVKMVRQKGFDAIVVDDGSTDSGGSIAQERGAFVIWHPDKKGKGQSLRDGFNYILSHGYHGVITMDGDGQHDPQDLDGFLKVLKKEENAGIIIGTRMHNLRGMPFLRIVTNKVMSMIISAICHQKITDTQCGFRLIKSDVLTRIQLVCSDFEIESEVLIEASRKGFKIFSAPIRTVYSNEKSKINPFYDTLRFLAYILKVIFSSER